MMTDRVNLTNKVPHVGLLFWLIKIMTTTVGETGADFLILDKGFGLMFTMLIASLILVVALIIQFSMKIYRPPIYWLTVASVSILGTLMTDYATDIHRIPLALAMIVFAILLAVLFALWFIEEQTLSIRAIDTHKREAFYWFAVLLTFAFGTAVGDFCAEDLDWGYLHTVYVFGGAIGAIALTFYLQKINAVSAFWLTYIATRPFGAGFADYLSLPRSRGGLDLGATNVSCIFAAAIILCVLYLTRRDDRVTKNSDH